MAEEERGGREKRIEGKLTAVGRERGVEKRRGKGNGRLACGHWPASRSKH